MSRHFRAPAIALLPCILASLAVSCGSTDPTNPTGTNPGDTTTVHVEGTGDVGITNVQLTQGVQDSAGSIPMVLNGNPAVANVYVSATSGVVSAPVRLVLRLYNASQTLASADTLSKTVSGAAVPVGPTAQFLIASSRLAAGMSWQVALLPPATSVDDTTANDLFPRAAPAALATTSVPPLTIRFVPIVLSANGNTVSPISTDDLGDYLRTLHSVHPLGVVNAHIGTAFTTGASFGTGTSGGDATFWIQLISELDLARIADPSEPTANWFGVVRPPPGFTFTNFGGFSYIPTSGSATGANTRTSAAVGPGWFNSPTQSRDLVAHEIGHTFGRAHAPCGGAVPPLDPNYPLANGHIDVQGFDVYDWSTGDSTSATAIPTSTGDVMGYCFPVWASTYTYKAVLNFRAGAVVASRRPDTRTHVLVVRGSIDDQHGVTLAPVFALDAAPTPSEPDGAYTVTGSSATGAVLFSYRVNGAVIDHTPHVRHFTVTVPDTPGLESQLASVHVSGPEGSAAMMRAPAPAGGASLDRTPVLRRNADGTVGAGCGSGARGIVVLNAATGAVLGVGESGGLEMPASTSASLTVLCSDGITTSRFSGVVPLQR